MRVVPVKSEETQGAAMVFRVRVRELLIRQRTQVINALRSHLTEFGQIVAQGAANATRLIAIVEDPDGRLPTDAIATLKVLVATLAHLEGEIGNPGGEITRRSKANDVARREMTVPGHRAAHRYSHRGLGLLPRLSAKHAISRPGWIWCHGSIPLVVRSALGPHWRLQRHLQTAQPCCGPPGASTTTAANCARTSQTSWLPTNSRRLKTLNGLTPCEYICKSGHQCRDRTPRAAAQLSVENILASFSPTTRFLT
jgi:hypothetical protein